ncbi:class I SAM-dependent methyltransferase [Leptospira yasudae]|uniref:class I SAM-dependent methyltransferase n=1 Tax=Leptospira yasudae TaxID=2202201 RepID=UPI00109180C5|nr:class I SAM-dependent methyltransferase [Leptospira yasudae]TGM96652.1 class I SAM-dependent methyltransferase [Leptospira yasudae]
MEKDNNSSGSYFKYSSFGLSSYVDWTIHRIRKQIHEVFLERIKPKKEDFILDVGVSDADHASSNFLEANYLYPEKITAVSNENHIGLEKIYPGLKFVHADGRKLPFSDRSFDCVYSHAVIEHVGVKENQISFLKELVRVAKSSVFITTPNRWHPIEFHTGFPLLHYLPKLFHLKLYGILGKKFYASIDNLNLISEGELLECARSATKDIPCSIEIASVSWLGIKSNLILIIKK